MAFIVLALIGVAAIVTAVKVCGRPAEFAALYVTAGSFCATADWVAHGWLGLYRYHPGFLDDPFRDSLIGAILAEMIFVGALSVFLAAFLPRWAGVLAGMSLVTAIEYCFEAQGWLRYRGWALWLTTSGFAVYLSIVLLYGKRLLQTGLTSPPLKRIARIGLLVYLAALLSVAVSVTKASEVHLRLLPTKEGSHALFRFFTYPLFLSALGYWVLRENRPEGRWARTALATLLVGVLEMGLAWLGVETFHPPWNWWLNALSRGGVFCLANLADWWLSAHASLIVPEWRPPPEANRAGR